MECDVAVLGGGPGRLYGGDPGRAARREGRLRRAGAGARRHLPARRLHPDQGLGADGAPPAPGARRLSRKLGVSVAEPALDFDAANEWKARCRRADDGRRRLALQGQRRRLGARERARFTRPEHARRRGRRGRALRLGGDRDRIVRRSCRRSPGSTRRSASTRPGLLACSAGARAARRSSAAGSSAASSPRSSTRFGSEVTIIEMLPRLIPAEDDDAAAELAKAFARRGIALELGKQCTQVDRAPTTR